MSKNKYKGRKVESIGKIKSFRQVHLESGEVTFIPPSENAKEKEEDKDKGKEEDTEQD
ncbi:hypothetical protein [Bacillus sp. EB01]|uniref:hypothetical protein n=1 Tax=Bacillus sp. EB01 TaxID=1347086 RepID=UPI000A5FB4DB|nr:hypothetical protein [Bacillus sp. EB01]